MWECDECGNLHGKGSGEGCDMGVCERLKVVGRKVIDVMVPK